MSAEFTITRQRITDRKRMDVDFFRIVVFDHRSGKPRVHAVVESISSRSAIYHARQAYGSTDVERALIKAAKVKALEHAVFDPNYEHD